MSHVCKNNTNLAIIKQILYLISPYLGFKLKDDLITC
jgi:hypothetical protein